MNCSRYWADIDAFAQDWTAALRSGRFDYSDDMGAVLAMELRRHPRAVDLELASETLYCSNSNELELRVEEGPLSWAALLSDPFCDPAELPIEQRAACAFLMDAWDRMTEILGCAPDRYVERRRDADR